MKKLLLAFLLFPVALVAQLTATQTEFSASILVQPQLQYYYFDIQNNSSSAINLQVIGTIISQENVDENISFQMCLGDFNGGGFGICIPGLSITGNQFFPVFANSTLPVGMNFINVSVENSFVIELNIFERFNPSNNVVVTLNVDAVNPLNVVELNRNLLGTPYPNPVNNTLNIPVENNSNQMEIAIYDVVGKKVSQEKLGIGVYNHQINVANLPKGLYLVSMINETGIISTRKIYKR